MAIEMLNGKYLYAKINQPQRSMRMISLLCTLLEDITFYVVNKFINCNKANAVGKGMEALYQKRQCSHKRKLRCYTKTK